MPREKTKPKAVTVGKAKAGDRVAVQLVMPYDLLLLLRAETGRRATAEPAGMPSVSDVACELIRAGLAKSTRR